MSVKFNAQRHREYTALKVADKLAGDGRRTLGSGVIQNARWEQVQSPKSGKVFVLLTFDHAGIRQSLYAGRPDWLYVTDDGSLGSAIGTRRYVSVSPVIHTFLTSLGLQIDAVATDVTVLNGIDCILIQLPSPSSKPQVGFQYGPIVTENSGGKKAGSSG